jgi:hypothetical protein
MFPFDCVGHAGAAIWLPQPTLAHADNVSRSLPHNAAEAADGLLQFQSGEHVLGFVSDGMVVSDGTYALQVAFVEANAVKPQTAEDEASAGGGSAAPDAGDLSRPVGWYHAGLRCRRRHCPQHLPTWSPAPIRQPSACATTSGTVGADGSLRIDYETGELRESAPVAWQEIAVPCAVEVVFVLLPGGEVSFCVGRYDAHYPLTIDPTLAWNTFLGGDNADSVPPSLWTTAVTST